MASMSDMCDSTTLTRRCRRGATPCAPAPPPDHAAAPAHAEAFNFAYRVRRQHHFPWIPLAVFDDGVHCYIKLPPQAAH